MKQKEKKRKEKRERKRRRMEGRKEKRKERSSLFSTVDEFSQSQSFPVSNKKYFMVCWAGKVRLSEQKVSSFSEKNEYH